MANKNKNDRIAFKTLFLLRSSKFKISLLSIGISKPIGKGIIPIGIGIIPIGIGIPIGTGLPIGTGRCESFHKRSKKGQKISVEQGS